MFLGLLLQKIFFRKLGFFSILKAPCDVSSGARIFAHDILRFCCNSYDLFFLKIFFSLVYPTHN